MNPVVSVTGGEGVIATAAEAVRRAAPRNGRTRVVAIDGRSGAGKTSLAAGLRAELSAPVVALEDLYGGWDGLERGIDLLVSEVLEPLSAGRAARVPRYDWVAAAWGTPWVLEPPGVLIVEGVGAGARRAAAYESVLDLDGGTAHPFGRKEPLTATGRHSPRTGTCGPPKRTRCSPANARLSGRTSSSTSAQAVRMYRRCRYSSSNGTFIPGGSAG